MRYLLYLISLLWLFAGGALIFAPELVRKLVDRLSKAKNFKLIGTAGPFLVALILFFGAGQTTFPMFAQVLAVIALAKGVAHLVLSPEKVAAIIVWWLGAPEMAQRLWGLLAGGLGLILYKIIL